MKPMKWLLSIALSLWLVNVYANLPCEGGGCTAPGQCGEDPGEPDAPPPTTDCPDTAGATTSELSSLNYSIYFGLPANEKVKVGAKFSIYTQKPSPTVFSPQGLQYRNKLLDRLDIGLFKETSGAIGLPSFDHRVYGVGNGTAVPGGGGTPVNPDGSCPRCGRFHNDVPTDAAAQIKLITDLREPLVFNFANDTSAARGTGSRFYENNQMTLSDHDGNRLSMLSSTTDANRSSVNSRMMFSAEGSSGSGMPPDLAYYNISDPKGYIMRYSAETGEVAGLITPSGRVILPGGNSAGLEAIYDDAGSIRQVWSKAQGLADVVVTAVGISYEVRIYASDKVGGKSNGLYTVSGDPHTVIKVENPNPGQNNRVKFTKTVNGASEVVYYEYSYAQEAWMMTQPDGLQVISQSTTWDYSHIVSTTIETIKTSTGEVAQKSSKVICRYDFGDRPMSVTLDPDGMNYRTTYSYYTDKNQTGNYGRVKTVSDPGGNWKRYQYDAEGRMVVKTEAWLSSAFDAPAEEARAIYYSYAPLDSRDTVEGADGRPRTIEEKILGITIRKEFFAYYFDNDCYVEIHEKATDNAANFGATSNLRTVKRYYPRGDSTSPSAGKLHKVTNPDGTLETYTYEYGNYLVNVDPAANSFSPNANGSALRTTIVYGTVANPDGIAGKTTKAVTIHNDIGKEAYSENYVYTGSDYARMSWTCRTFDEIGRETSELKSNGELHESTWSCCNLLSETLPDGTHYTYVYDALKRLVSKTKIGVNGQPDLVTTYTYNAAGKQLTETVTGGSLSQSTGMEYNLAGLPTKAITRQGLEISFSYLPAINTGANRRGVQVSATLPGGATQVHATYCDGQPQSLTGTAQTPVYYLYGVEADGRMWRQERTGGGDSPRRTTAYRGMNKELQSVVRSGFGGDVSELYFYNAKNQLTKVTRTGSAPILMTYDELGKRSQTGLDVDNDGVLTPASNDRIDAQDRSFVMRDNDWWSELVRRTYATAGSDTATTVSTEMSRLSGFSGSVAEETRRIDIHGNVTTELTTLDRANFASSISVQYPDSPVPALRSYINGLIISERSSDNLTKGYAYDSLARLTSVTDPRLGATTFAYHTGTGVDGLLASTTDAAGNPTEFGYDSATGRLVWIKNALNKYTRYAYNNYGLVTRIWGDTQYPLEFTYDTLGQQVGMKTYRTGSDWNSATWPENVPAGDLTTWMYDPASGLVTSKVDAALKAVNYTYTVDGNLATRTWARGIVTNYGYDPATGKLLTVDYADSTPDITYTYNRLGQLATVVDAAGTHTFSYDAALNRIGEAIAGIYAKNLNYTYANTGVKGRYTGFSLDNLSNSVYSYDSYGRLNQIDGLGGSFTYSRLANSRLFENLTRPNGVNTQWAYEAHRNLATQVANGAVSTFGYVNDALGLRISMSRSGSAFTTPDVLTYGYNDRNEVTSATSNNNAAYNYAYNYDPIGNRNTANLAGTSVLYTANALNQYTAVNTDAPTYDFDGNMLTNGAWTYTWNGENRMIAAQNGSTRLEFAYDYMGRRVEKKVYDGETLSKHTKFVYNGFKLAEELDALNSNATLRKYTWQPEVLGLDVPLAVYDATLDATYFYATDANKNVSELTDSTGALVAHYEYSPFGTQTVATGAYAATNPFRFSSEYFDAETGLVYYNYRFYSPALGRWISRDPIEESGGKNLYNMVNNGPPIFWDNKGMGCKDLPSLADYLKSLFDWRNNIQRSVDNLTDPFEKAAQKISDILVELNDPNINEAIDFILDKDVSVQLGVYADYAFFGGAGLAVEFDFTKTGTNFNVNFNSNLGYGASVGVYGSTSLNSSTSLPYINAGTGASIKGPVGVSGSSGGGRNGGGISVGAGFGNYGTISNKIW